MRITKALLLSAVAAIGMNSTASATSISGDWTGNWSGSNVTATFTMTIDPVDSLGRFNGSFDWTCTSGITCSGVEYFTGGMGLNDTFTFWTTGFLNAVNLAPSVYWGSAVDGGLSLLGWDKNPGDYWTAQRVSAPEPTGIALMGMGLLAMAFAVRRKSAFAKQAK